MLEFHRSLFSVALAFDADVGCHEADDIEITAQFLCVPHLSVMGFESFPATGLVVDLDDSLAANGFSWIVDRFILSCWWIVACSNRPAGMKWRTNSVGIGSAVMRYLVRAVVCWNSISKFISNSPFIPLLHQTLKNKAGIGVVPELSQFTHPVRNHDDKEDVVDPAVVTPAALVEMNRRTQVVQVLGTGHISWFGNDHVGSSFSGNGVTSEASSATLLP